MANPLPMDEWPYDVPGAFSILSCGFHRALWHGTAKLKNQVRETSWDITTIYLHGCRSISMFIPLMIFQFLSISYTHCTHIHIFVQIRFWRKTIYQYINLQIYKTIEISAQISRLCLPFLDNIYKKSWTLPQFPCTVWNSNSPSFISIEKASKPNKTQQANNRFFLHHFTCHKRSTFENIMSRSRPPGSVETSKDRKYLDHSYQWEKWMKHCYLRCISIPMSNKNVAKTSTSGRFSHSFLQ